MKKITINLLLIISLLFIIGCQEEDNAFGDLSAPTNIQIEAIIQGVDSTNPYGDGSGIVKFTTTANNAISYKYVFSDATSQNSPNGVFQKRFTQTGINEYTVTAIASGKGGVSSNAIITIEVRSDFTDNEAIELLTAGTTQNWYFSASEAGHFGVGPNNTDETQNYYPFYYQAAPWEKAGSTDSGCLYENVLTFTKEGDLLKYELNNGGKTFFNATYESVVGGSSGSDFCYNYTTSGEKTINLSPSESVITANANATTQTRGTMLNFSDNGFMGYYIGQSSYEILSITSNRMVVRAVMGNNPDLAWYHTFTTVQPVQVPDVDYTNLVFSDEFNTDGVPDPSKWGYDLGAGGWGNNESQHYTNSATNVIVQGGNLKITAKAESFSGSNYTSARLKTENKFEFTYGKVEVKAKLPVGGGTWPAIWMLGENHATVGWPACGEIDIMEYVGNNPDVVLSTLHFPGNSGGNGVTGSTTVTGASSQFHVYKTIWSPTTINFYVDDQLFHSMPNNSTIPFNNDFFLILNVAMGGNLGGAISPSFTESAMEIDYVRIYQ